MCDHQTLTRLTPGVRNGEQTLHAAYWAWATAQLAGSFVYPSGSSSRDVDCFPPALSPGHALPGCRPANSPEVAGLHSGKRHCRNRFALRSVLPAPYLSIPGKKSPTPRCRVPFPAASPGPTSCRRLASQHSLQETFPSLFRFVEWTESFFDNVQIFSKLRYIEKSWSVC